MELSSCAIPARAAASYSCDSHLSQHLNLRCVVSVDPSDNLLGHLGCFVSLLRRLLHAGIVESHNWRPPFLDYLSPPTAQNHFHIDLENCVYRNFNMAHAPSPS